MGEMDMTNRGQGRPEMKHGEGHEDMSMAYHDRLKMLNMHHGQTVWVYWLVIILGFWQLLMPATFDYSLNPVNPSGGREVWISLSDRVNVLRWSDIISGILLIIFGYRSLTPNRPVSVWLCCFVGIWLSMAPLIFWAPSAVIYLNDTLIGVLVIALTILIPGMPNMIMYMEMGADMPKGWSYNPSSWPQRWIMIVTGFLGWVVSRYLAAYQLGYIPHPFDPFFDESSRLVLDSAMSHSLPVSDAGLGSFAYTFEFLMGWMGSSSRWRTMPWMVTFFGILVIPLGLVHIFLVISQPLTVGYWCTFCLLAAGIMLPMIPLEVDEVIAMIQFMYAKVKKGEGFWKTFWKGGSAETDQMEHSPAIQTFNHQPAKIFASSIWGMSFPVTLALCSALGLWLMFSPAIYGAVIKTPPAMVNHLCGALVLVFSVLSMGEVLRAGRLLNILVIIGMIGAMWFWADASIALRINSTIAGILIMALSLPKGKITQQYGSYDKYIF